MPNNEKIRCEVCKKAIISDERFFAARKGTSTTFCPICPECFKDSKQIPKIAREILSLWSGLDGYITFYSVILEPGGEKRLEDVLFTLYQGVIETVLPEAMAAINRQNDSS